MPLKVLIPLLKCVVFSLQAHTFLIKLDMGSFNFDACSFIYSFAHSFIRSFVRSFIHSFNRPFIHSFIHPYNHSFVHSFVRPSSHPSIHPCIHQSTHTPIHISIIHRKWWFVMVIDLTVCVDWTNTYTVLCRENYNCRPTVCIWYHLYNVTI